MVTSWSLRLLTAMTGILLLASTADGQQLGGPIITPSQTELTLQAGQNFTLSCRGKRPIDIKHQDIPEDVTGPFKTELTDLVAVNDSEYEVELTLYNVDRFAVGYYACFDSTVNSTEVLTNVIDEPNNTAHISYIYIYVNDSSMFAPMRAVVVATSNSKFIIECRPTTPDIKVKLTLDFADVDYERYSHKVGFTLDSDILTKTMNIFTCEFMTYGHIMYNEYKDVFVHKYLLTPPPVPKVIGGPRYFLQGDTFSVNCTINTIKNSPGYLTWTIPGEFSKVTNSSNEYERRDDQILFNNYVIKNANSDDAGNYVCMSKNSYGTESATFVKEFLAQPVINMTKSNPASPLVTDMKVMILKVNIDEYPPTNITVFRDNNFPVGTKANVTVTHDYDKCTALCKIIIRPVAIEDTGNYTVVATNQHISKSVTFDFRVEAPPIVDFVLRSDGRYLVGSKVTFICEVVGYTLPVVDWIFSNANGEQVVNKKNQHDTVASIYRVISRLTIPVRNSGNLTCLASNSKGLNSIEREIIVYEMSHGLGIKDHEPWFSEGDNVILECAASKHDFVNVTWYRPDFEDDTGREDVLENVNFSKNFLSLIAKLEMDQIALEEAGTYVCVALRINGSSEREYTSFSVAELKIPQIDDFEDKNEEVDIFLPTNITCTADAVPPPEISWYKDGEPLFNYSEDKNKVTIETFKVDYSESNTSMVDYSTRYSVVKIERMEERNVGKYECRVSSGSETKSKFYNLQIKEKPTHKTTYLSVIGVIFFMLIILVVYLAWKIRKEKQFRKELAAAGLLNFKEGVTKSINPDLGIDEQAELLPYDEKFEFPVEKLILGKQLGAGAFGVVYKADARGITNAEETKTVAVKMVKKTADNMYIKALASELKIMVHLGKHINIVNLLGACTKNVGKRELIVIVEYCKYGNIHNYMQKHREVFIDQLTDNSEKNLGKINRAYSCSSGNSGMHSDYFGSNHTQETDHTFVNTANTNRSTRKVSETGYVQPEWRSNYESDYSFEGRAPRPLCSRDLLAWAFQIARGMEYLASRKVLHGDLAARNVLLADDNIVKICDFGLARSIYKNDEYQKKENSPLPVKWLAIECMTDRIFSTQSDVWSFGIVLWELFSLAKTPYPNVSPHALLDFLSQGRRLDKPAYSDDKLYDVMMRCWDQKPTARPTFSQLQQILGSFLEDNVRNHYVDLNASYMDMNIRREGEDYLAMVNAPDYNNMVTPSPHHYVNEVSNFFPPTPTQLQHDDEGYLQMSPATKQAILNARAQNSKFDFDSRKLAPRAGEPNSYGSELTPMLTLNNLPRNGSESDHEGNTSPYLNMCPRIEEETDEVFETKHNNAKNMLPSAVTNPTYITFSADDEKKPSNFSNNYINVSVPNGLVK